MKPASKRVAILLGGIVAGTVDIFAPSLIYMVNPIRILHTIAAGLIGRDASVNGGIPTAALGVGLQWAMSILIAAIYVIAAQYIPLLKRMWIVGGLAYGVGVFFVMTYIVVPLSAIGHGMPQIPLDKFIENLAAMLLFGLIVAFFARGTRPGA